MIKKILYHLIKLKNLLEKTYNEGKIKVIGISKN